MPAPQGRDGATLKTTPRQTGGRFCTYADRNEAPIYRDLAEKARAAGHKISAGQVRRWVMDELLPSPGHRVSKGRAGFRTERHEGIEEQLLALCEFRATTNSWDRLTILLWAYEWRVPTERYRRAVLAELPEIPDPNALLDRQPKTLGERDPMTLSEDELDKFDRAAVSLAPRYRRLLRRRDESLANDVTSAVFAMAIGAAERTSHMVADALHHAAHIGPLSDPTLSGHDPVAELELFRSAVSMPKLRALIEQASAEELEASRPRVRGLLRSGVAPPIVAVMLATVAPELGIDALLDALSAENAIDAS